MTLLTRADNLPWCIQFESKLTRVWYLYVDLVEKMPDRDDIHRDNHLFQRIIPMEDFPIWTKPSNKSISNESIAMMCRNINERILMSHRCGRRIRIYQ